MRHTPKIKISFRIGHEKWSQRVWWAAPRVGDVVILGAGKDRFKPDHNGDALFRVDQVTWGAESPDEESVGWQSVICHISHIPDDKGPQS